jgi:uncharacterized protein with PIN domain
VLGLNLIEGEHLYKKGYILLIEVVKIPFENITQEKVNNKQEDNSIKQDKIICPYCNEEVDLTKNQVDYNPTFPHMFDKNRYGNVNHVICGEKLCDRMGWDKEMHLETLEKNKEKGLHKI